MRSTTTQSEHRLYIIYGLRGVITKLSTNWRELKLLLREKGLLRDNQSVVDLRGSTPPSQAVSDNLQGSTPPPPQFVIDLQGLTPPADTQLEGDFQESAPPTNIAESTEAIPTKEGFIGPVRPNDTTRCDETIESNIEPSSEKSFISPVIPGSAVKSTDSDIELISLEPGPATVGFIGPVIPSSASKSVTPNQIAVYVELSLLLRRMGMEIRKHRNRPLSNPLVCR